MSHDDASEVRLSQAFANSWPTTQWSDHVVLVGVSGGADSMTLLELIIRNATDLDRVKVVHCNHGLRGEESDLDEAFVIEHCLERGVECLSLRIAAGDLESASEDALRQVRFRHYIETAKQVDARWIALGHHRDDNVETFFLRLFRGSGIRGLAGIPKRRTVARGSRYPVEVIRPLLSFSKNQLENWLREEGISFREDSSNRTAVYQRNRLRQQLVPVLDTLYGPSWRKHVIQLMETMALQSESSESEAKRLLSQHWNQDPTEKSISLPLSLFVSQTWEVNREMIVLLWHELGWSLRPWTRQTWHRLKDFLAAAAQTKHPKRLELPGKVVARVRKGIVYFERPSDS